MIDTHTHLYDAASIQEQDDNVQRALDAGISKMYMPNCDSHTLAPMMAIAAKYPQHCLPMIGLHPCYVKDNYEAELAIMQQQLTTHNFAAIGEVGLDFYWDRSHDAQQKIAFEQQIDWALQYHLPVIIHSRSSTKECIDIIKKKQNGQLTTLFHCYSGTLAEAQEIIALGGYLGIGGVVTYKKTNLPEILSVIGLAHIVLETDAPYLAPVPYRGKPNESAYLPLIAQKIADIFHTSLQQVADITTANAQKIFR